MKDRWICPGCGARHTKTFSHGAVRGQSGPYVARELLHPDVACDCGITIQGHEIVGGLHDEPGVTVSPFARCLASGMANGLFWGGLAYMFTSVRTALIVGGVMFAGVWVFYFTGQVKPFEMD